MNLKKKFKQSRNTRLTRMYYDPPDFLCHINEELLGPADEVSKEEQMRNKLKRKDFMTVKEFFTILDDATECQD